MNILQRTPEWYLARKGKVTASSVYKIMETNKKGEPTAKYEEYLREKIAERMLKIEYLPEQKTSLAMRWGIEHEEEARMRYWATAGFINLLPCGFIDHPTIAMSGASPDGLVEKDGLIEIKCPNTTTHVEFLLTGYIDPRYHWQMQWQMECARRQWCDFVSYDPRIDDPDHQIKIVRIPKDPEQAEHLRSAVAAFNEEVERCLHEQLRQG